MENSNTSRVLIIEDCVQIARSWQRTLSHVGFCVGTAADLDSGRSALEDESWDVVLLDLVLPGGNGIQLIELAKDRNVRVAVVSANLDGNIAVELLEHCIPAIPKPVDSTTLVKVVKRLVDWRGWAICFCEEKELSPQEQAVLCAAIEGLSNKQIADKLGVRLGTITQYWSRIFKKVRYRSKPEVIAAMFRLRCSAWH